MDVGTPVVVQRDAHLAPTVHSLELFTMAERLTFPLSNRHDTYRGEEQALR